MLLSMIVLPVSAAEAGNDWHDGTLISYNAEDPDGDGVTDNSEAYTVAVPAAMKPGTTAEVAVSGTWNSNRMLVMTSDTEVTLVNSINSNNEKILDVDFDGGIDLIGSNTNAVSATKDIAVSGIDSALFGTWSGTFNYYVDMVDVSNGSNGGSPATVEPKDGLANYSWSEIKTIAQGSEPLSNYNINIGDTKTDSGKTYILVSDERNEAYGGLVFMFDSGISDEMNSAYSNAGGYVSSDMKLTVDILYNQLPAELRSVIKTVTISCNDGTDNYTTTHTASVKVFVPALREVSGTQKSSSPIYNPYLNAEGNTFDWFTNADTEQANRSTISSSNWWLRSAYINNLFWYVGSSGGIGNNSYSNDSNAVVLSFVIGAGGSEDQTDADDQKAYAYALILDNSSDANNPVPMIFVREDTAPIAETMYESETYGSLKISKVYSDFETSAHTWSDTDVTSVVFEDRVFPKSTEEWFYNMEQCTSMDLAKLDTARVTYMSYMFRNCSSLTSLDVSGFDTSRTTEMDAMFWGCSGLTSLDVSNFDTSKVIDMGSMFRECGKLTNLDVGKWDISKVTNMACMFQNCSALTSLDVSNWNTFQVSNMTSMFSGCSGLTSLDVSNWNTSQLLYADYMFNDCSGLTSLDVSNFTTSKVLYMDAMFKGCSGLTSLDLNNWNTYKLTSMNEMFDGCSKLTSLNVDFGTAKVKNMSGLFRNCNSLTSLDLGLWNTSIVTNMGGMFSGCSELQTIYVGNNWTVAHNPTSSNMFYDCLALVGENGTSCAEKQITDASYACIDTETTPGYLTNVANKPQ